MNADNLQQQLTVLNQAEKEIELIKNQLSQERAKIDNTLLPQQAEEWRKHRDEYFNVLTTQLEANGIVLNDAEKKELQTGSEAKSSIQEKLKALKKLNINLPDTAADFIIIVYDAIVAEQSRSLKRIDNNTIKSIIKKLTVIDDENKAANKLKLCHAKQYEEVITTATKLSNQLAKIKALYN